MKKLIKAYCELNCGETNKNALHFHHIIPQNQVECTNDPNNIAVICASCHEKVHSNNIIIIGVLPSTKLPNKRTLIYEINGIKNIDIEIPKVFKKSSYELGNK